MSPAIHVVLINLMMSVLVMQLLSVGAVRFENRFYASKKGGKGGGGWVSAWGAVHIAAALAGYKKP